MGNRDYTRTCIVCQDKYKYCAHCGEYNPREPWRYLYCSENCKAIFKVCNDFNNGNINQKDAKSRLDKLNIPQDKSLHPELVEIMRRINNESK